MRYRGHILASILTVAGMAIVAVLALSQLPAGTRLPVHWELVGVSNRLADARSALFGHVAVTAALALLIAALPRLDPLQDRLSASAPLYRTAWSGLLAFMVWMQAIVVLPVFGIAVPPGAMLVGVGALLVVLGNALPKSRPGFFVGIRTPWTLTDPENWIATHRYAARIMIAAGFALILFALLPMAAEMRTSFVVATLLVAVTTPVIYSFFYWRTTRTAR